MVSLKTQIASFSFDNCLMNAAGVSCMTVEELEAVRQSSAGTFITKTATLTPSSRQPRAALSGRPSRQHQFDGLAESRH